MHNFDDKLYWQGFTDSAQVLGGFATAISLVIATAAAAILIYQAKKNSSIAKETSALDTHRDYLKLCINMPELSSSQMMLVTLNRKSFVGILDENISLEVERALWFLSYVIHTAEQLLETNRGDVAWQSVVESQLSYHQDLIEEVWPTWRSHYGPQLVSIVEQEVLRKS